MLLAAGKGRRLTHSLEECSSYTAEAAHSLKKKKINGEEKVRGDRGGVQIPRRTCVGMQKFQACRKVHYDHTTDE